MNKTTREILESLARRCKRHANSAFKASVNEPSQHKAAMLRGKVKQATQIYAHIRDKYPSLNLPPIHQ